MAPEQINGVSDDVRSDLYALGAIWYELLTGWTPFDGDSAVKILMKHLQEEPPALKEMNPDCKASQLQEDLVHQLLSKDPMHRPQSAHQLLEMLEDLPEYTGPRTRLATQAGFMPAVNIPLPADERSDATRVGEAPVSKAAAGSRRDVPMVSQGTASRVRPVPSGGGSRAQNSAVRFPTQEVTMAQSNTGARPAVKSAVAPVASNKDPASDPQISQVFTHTNMRKAEVVAEPTPAPMPAPTPVRPSQTTSAAGAARRDTLPDDLPAVGRSMVPHFVGGILLTLGLGTGGYVVFRPSHSSQQLQRVEQPPTPPKPVADPAPVPAEAKKVTITVTSQPVGAQVLDGTKVLGKTPLELVWETSTEARALTLTLDGHTSVTQQVVADKERTVTVTLAKTEVATPPPDDTDADTDERTTNTRATSKKADRKAEAAKAKEEKAREAKAREAKAKEEKAKEDKAREERAKEDKAKEDKAREAKAKEEKAKADRARDEKSKEDKAREAKAREDKAREDKAKDAKAKDAKAKDEKKAPPKQEIEKFDDLKDPIFK